MYMYCACACVSACVCVYACVYVFPANLANLERLEQLEKERARQHQKNLLSQVGGMAGVERVWFSPHRGSDGEEGAGESVGGVPNRERVEAERVGGSVREGVCECLRLCVCVCVIMCVCVCKCVFFLQGRE